jgi:hypothetical protein
MQLCAYLRSQGYQVIVFSRSPQKARSKVPGAAEYVEWDYHSLQGSWIGALSGAYGVVHLAGASIFGSRWSEDYKKKLYHSRIESTRALVQAMERVEARPEVFVSGSAVGYYGHRGDTPLDESSEPGNDFLARTCVDWEREALQAEELGVRTVVLRTGIVLDSSGGALAQLKIPFQLFVGGPVLPGTQWLSWVHIDDEVGLIRLALENENIRGPLNATAPNPQTNADFSATLGRVLGTPSWLPVPGFALHLILGEFAEHLTHGQRVLPDRAQEHGYQFRYPTADEALGNLLGHSR